MTRWSSDLVARARGGDKRAWDALVERYAPLIWSICRRYRLGRDDADDVGQSVWMRLVDQLDKIRNPAALAGWLATTTRRECGRLVRAARAPGAVVCELDAEIIPDRAGRGGRAGTARGRTPCGAARGVHSPAPGRPAADRHAHRGPAGGIRRDQRQAGHTHRQHRPDPQPLPGQDAPPPGRRSADQRRVRLAPGSHGRGQLSPLQLHFRMTCTAAATRTVREIPVTKMTRLPRLLRPHSPIHPQSLEAHNVSTSTSMSFS